MLGSASKSKSACPARVRFGRRGCPTLSHLSAAGGTAKSVRGLGVCLRCLTCLT